VVAGGPILPSPQINSSVDDRADDAGYVPLNPIEGVWKATKKLTTHNRFHRPRDSV
jgi:hypothetical protein